jgi:hypothetical protein
MKSVVNVTEIFTGAIVLQQFSGSRQRAGRGGKVGSSEDIFRLWI